MITLIKRRINMIVKKLYRYKRADGGVTISPIKPDNTDYKITHRLIADTGMELVRNDIHAICVDTDDIEGWIEIEKVQEDDVKEDKEA
jgi:hypothetical protein